MNRATILKEYYFVSIVFTGSVGFMVWGYANAISNAVLPYIRKNLFPEQSDFNISMIASVISVGGALGSSFASYLVTNIGRRKTLLFCDYFLIFGAICTTIENYQVLLFGRFMQGIIIGIYSVAGPIYTLEMCPKEKKGMASTLNLFIMNAAIMVAYAVGYIMPDSTPKKDSTWKAAYMLLILPPLSRILIFNFIFTEETPTFLLSVGKDFEAHNVLRELMPESADALFSELQKDLRIERSASKNNVTFSDLLSGRYKNAFIMGILIALIFQVTGLNIMMVFPNEVFRPGIDNLKIVSTISLLMGTINTFSKILATRLVETYGRRGPLTYGLFGTALTLFLFAFISFVDSPGNWLAKIVMILWPIPFSISVGSLGLLYIAEILPPIGVGVCIQVLWISAFFFVQAFLPIKSIFGLSGIFFGLSLLSFLGGIYFYLYALETKGKSKGEICLEYQKSGGPFPNIVPESQRILLDADETAL